MAESKYSLRLAAVDAFSRTFASYEKASDELRDKIQSQRTEIERLNRAARDARGFEELSQRTQQTAAALQGARVEQARLTREQQQAGATVERLSAQLQQASARAAGLAGSTGASTAEVRSARAEQKRLEQALNGATAEVRKLDVAQDKNTASVRTLEAAQRTERNELTRLQQALTSAGVDTSRLASEQKRLEAATEQANGALQAQRARLEAVSSAQGRVDANRSARAELRGQVLETAALGYLAAKPITHAMDLEVAMADVAKTVDFGEGERQAMANANLRMASDRLIATGGLTAVDLAKIQAAAGQSGIGANAATSAEAKAEIVAFTRDAAIMAAAFGMSAEEAGKAMAGWRASMSLDQAGAMALADAANHLGNLFNAETKDIASIVGRFGAVGDASGLTPEQSAALSAALLNPGTNVDVAGTGFKNFLAALTKGRATGGTQRKVWEELGFDPEDLAYNMQQNAPATIMEVLRALQEAPEEEQSALATTLFGSESIGAIMPLLSNLEAVEKAFGSVGDSTAFAGSMIKEAEGLADTSRNSWNQFTARLTRLSSLIGAAMLPALDAVLTPLGAVIDGISWFAETFPGVTSAVTVAVGALVAAKVAAMGLKFAGLMMGQAFNKADLARAKLDATTATTATSANAAVARLNAVLARMGMGGAAGAGGGLGGGAGAGRGKGVAGKLAGAGRLAMPLVAAAGVMDMVSLVSNDASAEDIGGSAGSTLGGMGGMWMGAAAGAALGSVVPVIGTAIGGLIGGALGGLGGSSLGEWIGRSAGGLFSSDPSELVAPSKLGNPDDAARAVAGAVSSSRSVTFAPVLHLTPSGDPSYDQRLADQVMGRLQADFVPLMMANPLDVRRSASLTDGSD